MGHVPVEYNRIYPGYSANDKWFFGEGSKRGGLLERYGR